MAMPVCVYNFVVAAFNEWFGFIISVSLLGYRSLIYEIIIMYARTNIYLLKKKKKKKKSNNNMLLLLFEGVSINGT